VPHVTGGATNDGAKLQIYDCNGTGAQQRITTDEGTIIKPIQQMLERSRKQNRRRHPTDHLNLPR
jgi:hypothetical protein